MIFEWTKEWLSKQGPHHQILENVDSSNSYAKKMKPEFFSMILAHHQSLGRGRFNRSWVNSDLMCSFTWLSSNKPRGTLSCLAGIALYTALTKNFPDLNWSIKAPNDICTDEKKIAGILTEIISESQAHQVVIGVGINVLHTPSLIKEDQVVSAASIHEYTPVDQNKWTLFLNDLYAEFKEIELHQSVAFSRHQNEVLTQALRAHPSQKGLKQVNPDGSLIYEDRSVPWNKS